MFDRLEIFTLANARAQHAAARQALVARNIANSDTPGYRAQDINGFEETWRRLQARDTAPGGDMPLRVIDAETPASPNGNTVSLELEMLRGVDAQRAHSRALQIYGSALNILRTSIGR